MKRTILFLALLPLCMIGQENTSTIRIPSLQFGMRSTISLFSSDEENIGTGVGGQFRVRLAKRINTEWFADYITSDVYGLGRRNVGHIGWSVMFYPFNAETIKGQFTPYILAGHCFDYNSVTKNASNEPAIERWSSAVQGGLGTHYNLTDNFDFSLSAQYMMHLGDDVHVHKVNIAGKDQLLIEREKLGLEGHLLVTISVNVLIPDLRKKK
ncbi:MAG: hypothetical protein HYU69_13640 [Bacteroidetes bacterium]|nr:hypothetical protein [Bacteroidota bacterium]